MQKGIRMKTVILPRYQVTQPLKHESVPFLSERMLCGFIGLNQTKARFVSIVTWHAVSGSKAFKSKQYKERPRVKEKLYKIEEFSDLMMFS